MSAPFADRKDDRLTGYPDTDEVGTDWHPFRDALRSLLPAASLADRLLADGIEGIACRAFHCGHDRGYRLGVASGYSDALAVVANERERLSRRDGCFARCADTLDNVTASIGRMAK